MEILYPEAELETYEPPADSPYRQMNLFSLMSEQIGNVAVAQVERPAEQSFLGTIAAEHIEEILRTGGGKVTAENVFTLSIMQEIRPKKWKPFLRKSMEKPEKDFYLERSRSLFGSMRMECMQHTAPQHWNIRRYIYPGVCGICHPGTDGSGNIHRQ